MPRLATREVCFKFNYLLTTQNPSTLATKRKHKQKNMHFSFRNRERFVRGYNALCLDCIFFPLKKCFEEEIDVNVYGRARRVVRKSTRKDDETSDVEARHKQTQRKLDLFRVQDDGFNSETRNVFSS